MKASTTAVPLTTSNTNVVKTSRFLSDEERKKALNAPRRMTKIESMLEKYEQSLGEVDAEMLEVQFVVLLCHILFIISFKNAMQIIGRVEGIEGS